jgi:hypothetical protein
LRRCSFLGHLKQNTSFGRLSQQSTADLDLRDVTYSRPALPTLTFEKMHNMSTFDLLAAMQACMIYLVIFIIDYSAGDEENAGELLLALSVSPIPKS